MAGIVSGVNVITEFETPESASYSGYIDYMNKEQGKQEQYKEYKGNRRSTSCGNGRNRRCFFGRSSL